MTRLIAFLMAYACAWCAHGQAVVKPIFPEIRASTVANFGPGCRIRIARPETSEFSIAYRPDGERGGGALILRGLRLFPGEWILGLSCYPANEGHVRNGWAVPVGNGGWRSNDNESSMEMGRLNALSFHDLVSVNARGWAVAVDDTVGDERFRQRTLFYCIVRGPKAICGNNEMGYLKDIHRDPRADMTPQAICLLRSIEFLEDAPPDPLSESAHHPR
ncbi:hypothetical protein ACSFA7_32820 [Variovorax sp. LT1R20]|uniref:hypothetical protein n=1 Tax=Variovorax sp. LT1R20 TaxID=3443729 RepID=UPI003F4807E1